MAVVTDLRRHRVDVEFDDQRVDEPAVQAAVAGAATHGLIG